jgi:ADP-ribosylglycohydrolase
MAYPKTDDLKKLAEKVELWGQLKHESGARGIDRLVNRIRRDLMVTARRLASLPVDRALAAREPDALGAILALRPRGPRRMWPTFDDRAYADRLAGALLGRMAGCTLGAPVEFCPIDRMTALAKENGQAFPPTDYWTRVPEPYEKRYGLSRRIEYTKGGMRGVPVDDDIAYTLLGLLILEDAGPSFTVADVGVAWRKYLPYACTAEAVALANLRQGVPARRAGVVDNPYCEWIGADIRSDPWGYAAPGWPERAAAMAWRDAFISHRRQGIYGEMFFSAAIAAAFAVDDPVEALRIGLTEIPRDCALAKAIRWALRMAPKIRTHLDARAAMEQHFRGMHPVHTINNACLTVWGITIGGRDFSRVIGETVAMGMDNDCTAATAGSIVGAVVGRAGIDRRWTRPFGDTVHSYLIGRRRFGIKRLLQRFTRQAKRVWCEAR